MRKGAVGIFLALMFVLLLTFFLKQEDYRDRIEHFAELEITLAKIRQQFQLHHLSYGRFPRSNQEAELPAPEQLVAGSLDGLVVMEDQRLMLQLKLVDAEPATIFLTPEMNSADQFLWHCRSPDLPKELRDNLFGGCKLTREYLSLASASALQWKPKAVAKPVAVKTVERAADPPPQPAPDCTVAASSRQVLLHDNGLGIWDLSGQPRRSGFLPYDVKRADAFYTQIGDTLFVARDNTIAYADLRSATPQLQNTALWTKAGTRLYGIGKRLVWITDDQNLFVGDICQLPALRIIHTMTLDLGRREKIVRMDVVDDLVYMLSRHESDWGNSSELNIYRMKDNGTLLHRFHFRFDGLANSMQLAEPWLLVANGREGVTFYERTLDQRWMQAQKLTAVDFAMDVLLQDAVLWVADGQSGLLRFERKQPTDPWQRSAQQLLPFPAFHLRPVAGGLLVSSATQHAWFDPVSGQLQLLEPPAAGP
ncbi:MAG: hypothetical protein R3F47_17000 [Gammaproteobacteria bacterium]